MYNFIAMIIIVIIIGCIIYYVKNKINPINNNLLNDNKLINNPIKINNSENIKQQIKQEKKIIHDCNEYENISSFNAIVTLY